MLAVLSKLEVVARGEECYFHLDLMFSVGETFGHWSFIQVASSVSADTRFP